MATKVDNFVTKTLVDLDEIHRLSEQVAILAQRASNRWAVLGKLTMSGWDEYTWDNYPFTSAELAQALNNLTIENAVMITQLHTGAALDKINKLGF